MKGCQTKTVRLHLAPTPSTTPRSRATVFGNARCPGTGTAVSTAAILKLPADETYKYHGGAPGTGRSEVTKDVSGGHIQYYIPPTSFTLLDLVPEGFAQDILGIICISHVRMPVPFLIVWGEAYDFRDWESTARENWLWCKVLPASDLEGWDQIVPSMLPKHLLGSGVLGELVRGWKDGGTRDSIKNRTWPCNGDQVDVERENWLGVTLYEIVVTLAKDVPYSDEGNWD